MTGESSNEDINQYLFQQMHPAALIALAYVTPFALGPAGEAIPFVPGMPSPEFVPAVLMGTMLAAMCLWVRENGTPFTGETA